MNSFAPRNRCAHHVAALGGLIVALLARSAPLDAQTQTNPAGFVDLRLSSTTPHALFAGANLGGNLAIVGMLQDPRTEYRELVLGFGRTVGPATLALAVAHASDGYYAQLYLFPALQRGAVGVSGAVVLYEPMESSGSRQLHFNALDVSYTLTDHVSIGVSDKLSLQRGSTLNLIGPLLRIALPHRRQLTVAALWNDNEPLELRASVNVRF